MYISLKKGLGIFLNFLGDPLRVSVPDPHQSETADPDPHRSQKQDPNSNLHQRQLSGAVEAQKEAMEGLASHIEGLETKNIAVVVIIPFMRSKIRVRMKVIRRIGICIKVKRGIRIRNKMAWRATMASNY